MASIMANMFNKPNLLGFIKTLFEELNNLIIYVEFTIFETFSLKVVETHSCNL